MTLRPAFNLLFAVVMILATILGSLGGKEHNSIEYF